MFNERKEQKAGGEGAGGAAGEAGRATGCACSERNIERSLELGQREERKLRVKASMTAPTRAAKAPRGSRKTAGKPDSKGAPFQRTPWRPLCGKPEAPGSQPILGDCFSLESSLCQAFLSVYF